MNLPQIMKRNMPHMEFDANQCLRFSNSMQEAIGFGDGKNETMALDTFIMASMMNS